MGDIFLAQNVGTYSSSLKAPLGARAEVGSKAWLYVRYLDAVTYTTGMVCAPASATAYSVSNDVAGGSSTCLRFAGAVPNVDQWGNTVTAVPAQNDYGWLQILGYHSAIRDNGDDDIAQGDSVIMVATDGLVDSVAKATTTGTLLLVGIAADVDADATNTVPVWLKSQVW